MAKQTKLRALDRRKRLNPSQIKHAMPLLSGNLFYRLFIKKAQENLTNINVTNMDIFSDLVVIKTKRSFINGQFY